MVSFIRDSEHTFKYIPCSSHRLREEGGEEDEREKKESGMCIRYGQQYRKDNINKMHGVGRKIFISA